MAATEVQTPFVGNTGTQTAHSGKDELDQLKEIAKQALHEHERLKKKYEESQRIQRRLKDQLVSREQELIRIQSVSVAACDEFAEIKAQLEVEQFCREEAESYATKMVKQNKSIKRKSAAILGINNWASIEISLDDDDEDGTHENTSEQERLTGLKDELTALRKDLDVASEDKIVLKEELKALKQQLEQERLSNSALKDALKHRDRSIQQLSRVSTLVVNEFEEISENYERETVLRKKAECFAAKMYQENKVVSEVAKRQSQILMDPTQLTLPSDDKLMEAMKALEELNVMLGEKNEKQEKKVDTDDKVSTRVESVVPPVSEDLPPVSEGVPPVSEDVPPVSGDVPPVSDDKPPDSQQHSHVDDCPPDVYQHPPSVDSCPPVLADLSDGMSAAETTPEVVGVSAEITCASHDTDASDEQGVTDVVPGKTSVLLEGNHEVISGQSEEIDESSVPSGEPKPTASSSEEPKPTASSSEEPKPTSAPSEEPKPTSVPSEEPKPASVPSEEPKPSSVPSGEPKPTASSSEEPKPTASSSEEPKPTSAPSEEPKPTSVPSEEPKPASVPSEEPKPSSVPSGEPGMTSAASEDSCLTPITSDVTLSETITLSDDAIPPPEDSQVVGNDSSAASGQGIPAHVSEEESGILPDELIKARDELNTNEDNGQPKKEYVHTLETKLSIAQEENENLEQQINELQDELKKVKEQLDVASEKLRPPPPPPPPPLPTPVKNPLTLFRKLIKGKNTDDKHGKADPLQDKYTATIDEMMKRIKSGKAGLKPVGEDERRPIERGRSSKLSRKNTPTPAMMELNGLLKKTTSNRPPLIKSSSESEATSELLNIMNRRRQKMEIGESIKENGAKDLMDISNGNAVSPPAIRRNTILRKTKHIRIPPAVAKKPRTRSMSSTTTRPFNLNHSKGRVRALQVKYEEACNSEDPESVSSLSPMDSPTFDLPDLFPPATPSPSSSVKRNGIIGVPQPWTPPTPSRTSSSSSTTSGKMSQWMVPLIAPVSRENSTSSQSSWSSSSPPPIPPHSVQSLLHLQPRPSSPANSVKVNDSTRPVSPLTQNGRSKSPLAFFLRSSSFSQSSINSNNELTNSSDCHIYEDYEVFEEEDNPVYESIDNPCREYQRNERYYSTGCRSFSNSR